MMVAPGDTLREEPSMVPPMVKVVPGRQARVGEAVPDLEGEPEREGVMEPDMEGDGEGPGPT
jgi:hypothetical protein